MDTWKKEIDKINQCPQRQDSLDSQLRDLIKIANKLGMYDASDYMKKKIDKR